MFNKPTVFILGAGASWHYGYPTGEKLVRLVADKADSIAEQAKKGPAQINLMPEYVRGFMDPIAYDYTTCSRAWKRLSEESSQLAKALREVKPPVIDYFLNQNISLQNIAKIIIAWVILECEADWNLLKANKNHRDLFTESDSREEQKKAYRLDLSVKKDDWCRFVLYKLVAECKTAEELLQNQIKFITFNYDISLELRLKSGLQHIELFSKSPDVINQFFDNKRFLHIYGKVREVEDFNLTDFMSENSGSVLGINSHNSVEGLHKFQKMFDVAHKASQGIDTIAPDYKATQKDTLAMVRSAVEEATKIYILGYGFDRLNNDLLEIKPHLSNRHKGRRSVYFTNFRDINKVNKRAAETFDLDPQALIGSSIISSHIVQYEKSIHNAYQALEDDFEEF